MKFEEVRRTLLFRCVHNKSYQINENFVRENEFMCNSAFDDLVARTYKVLAPVKRKLWYSMFLSALWIGTLVLMSFEFGNVFLSVSTACFVCMNVDFFYSLDFLRLVHRMYIKKNFKVKIYRKGLDFTGYNFIYVASHPSDNSVVIVTSVTEPPKITVKNPKVYFTNKKNLYSIILEYKTNKKTKDLDAFCIDLYSEIYRIMCITTFLAKDR